MLNQINTLTTCILEGSCSNYLMYSIIGLILFVIYQTTMNKIHSISCTNDRIQKDIITFINENIDIIERKYNILNEQLIITENTNIKNNLDQLSEQHENIKNNTNKTNTDQTEATDITSKQLNNENSQIQLENKTIEKEIGIISSALKLFTPEKIDIPHFPLTAEINVLIDLKNNQ